MTLVFHVIIDFHGSYNSLVGHCQIFRTEQEHCQIFRTEQEQVSAIQMWYTD